MTTPQSDDLIGKTLGQFEILEEIGRGGMATVYSARQLSMNRTVAVKVLPRHFMHDPGFIERFEREVEVISQLEHPHILPIYDYGELDGMPYIAMRYLGGGSMAQWVRRGRIKVQDLVKPLTQISQAMDYAHQQGIIHRDLKPGNIMLDEGGNAYLSDFGIARVMGSDLTGSAIIGTPAYMSPEQAHGVPIDGRSDIYSLGIVVYELIAGREPFQSETPMGLLLMHINEPLPSLSEYRDDVPRSIERVIEKATAKDPDDRYPSAGDLAQAFTNALRGAETDNAAEMPTRKREQSGAPTIGVDAPPPPMAIPPSELDKSRRQATRTIGGQEADASSSTEVKPREEKVDSGGGRGWLYAVAGLVIVALLGGGALLASGAFSTPPDVIMPTPTPFTAAIRLNQPDYAITVPRRLLSSNGNYVDESDATRTLHRWAGTRDTGISVAVGIVSASLMSAEDYAARYYESQPSLRFIDESTAPDGTLRRSYRVNGEDSRTSGQLDAFFMHEGDKLAVLEIFTADDVASDSAVLRELQLILDSLWLT